MMDWDNLSETELKRLVVQLEKTKNDVVLDLKDAQLHLDHEGKEFHHFDYFCQLYRFETSTTNIVFHFKKLQFLSFQLNIFKFLNLLFFLMSIRPQEKTQSP
jgi:hypothetical protein